MELQCAQEMDADGAAVVFAIVGCRAAHTHRQAAHRHTQTSSASAMRAAGWAAGAIHALYWVRERKRERERERVDVASNSLLNGDKK